MFRPTQQQQQRPSHQIGINSQVQVKTECNSWMPPVTPSHISPNSKLLIFI
jgi:MAD (mothers against decapentaplegic) family protein 4